MRARLADAADHAGLLDIAYRTTDSPVGTLLLASTAAGIVRIAFEREDHEAVLATLAAAISPRILRSPRRTDRAARELDDYFGAAAKRSIWTSTLVWLVGSAERCLLRSGPPPTARP